jgi:hypothetical protein
MCKTLTAWEKTVDFMLCRMKQLKSTQGKKEVTSGRVLQL